MRRRVVFIVLFIHAVVAASLFAQRRETIFISERMLRIVGSGAVDTITVDVVEEKTVNIEHRADTVRRTAEFAVADFDRLEITTGAGADFVNVIDPAQTLDTAKKTIRFDAGEGDDVVVLSHAPFPREAAARIFALAAISTQLEDIAARARDATTVALVNDTMTFVERMRKNVFDEMQAIAGDAHTTLIAPASALTDRAGVRVAEQSKTVFERVNELTARHERVTAELNKGLDPTNGVFPPDNDAEPARGQEPTGPEPNPDEKIPLETRARIDQLARFAETVRDDARKQLEATGTEFEHEALVLQRRAEEILRRAERLGGTSDRLATEGERELTASADRVVAVVGELRSVAAQIDASTRPIRDEFQRMNAMLPESIASLARQAGSGSACSNVIATTHIWVGGSGADIFIPFSAPNASWSIDGGAGADFLVGGLVDDDIRGGDGNDIIFGLKGNDHIRGGDGNDLLVGEFLFNWTLFTGDDCIWGDAGVDFLIGDNIFRLGGSTPGGADTISGGAGTDFAFGDDFTDFVSSTLPGGNDRIDGDDDMDGLFGCGGDDDVNGNGDIDLAVGNGGDDTIHGHGGRVVTLFGTQIEIGNLLIGSRGADKVHGGDGVDVAFGSEGGDKIWGGKQLDVIYAGAGADVVRGEAGGVVFTITISGVQVPIRLGNLEFGGLHDDELWGGGDADGIWGQDGDDEAHGFDGNLQPLGFDTDFISGGIGNDDLEGDDEFLLLTNSADFILAGDGDDVVRGGSQSDLLFGERGRDDIKGDSNSLLLVGSIDLVISGDDDDDVDGGNSFDLLISGNGDDNVKGDDERFGLLSPDLIFSGKGHDRVNGGSGPDLIFADDGDDTVLGDSNYLWQPVSTDLIFAGNGADEADGGNASDLIFGQNGCDRLLGDNSTWGRISPDMIIAGDDDDFVDGGVNGDLAFGGRGNDTIVGDVGYWWMFLSADLLWGEEGCDTISGGSSADFIWGGAGVDHIDGQSGLDMIWGNDGGDTINGGDFLDLLWGNDGNDLIHGDNGPDAIWGGAGDDCVYGDDSPDFVSGGDGNDCVRGGSHADFLLGDGGDDRVFGDNGPDIAFGGAGDDKLDGGNGADILVGGGGSDEAWGGPGIDLLLAETRHQSGSSGLDCICNTEECTGTLCIRKFNDLNGSGTQNTGEVPLANWTFQVTCGCTSTSLTTDSNGNACATFYNGPCTVVEATQTGWQATTSTTQNVNVGAGQTSTATFGNRKPAKGELCIRKFNDANGNGVLDSGETFLSGFVFTLTGNGLTTSLTTGANGGVCTSLPTGPYTLVEQPRPGWTATTPTTQNVTLNSTPPLNVTFGNKADVPQRGELCVQKFFDKNRNGIPDSGEQFLGGWVFQVNGGSAGTLTTSPSGGMCTGFPVGTYTVTEVVQSGWIPTTPTTQTVTVVAGTATTVRFGNTQ